MNFCVVGAGAWGTAFAIHLARGGHAVRLLARREEQAASLRSERQNREYLPGVAIPAEIACTAVASDAVAGVDAVLMACPSHALRETCERVRGGFASARAPMAVSLTKGLELETHLRPAQVMAQALPGTAVGALTGPTNADEFARGLPAAMVLAAPSVDAKVAELQVAMSGPTLRIYTSEDLPGAELGGCLKNVYAIATGCCDGLKLGDNARAALLTRALAEMVRVGVALGARSETFYGLSGFGDLVATCHGRWSRNRDFGERIGRGEAIDGLLANRRTVVEGYRTTASFAGLCAEKGIDAPILREVHAILYERKKASAALASLMTRGLKSETAAKGG